MEKIRVAIVEDNYTYREALELYLSKVHDIQLAYIAGDLMEIPALIAAMPDVVIMDIDLGANSGIEGVKLIKEKLPGTGIFMLTVFDDEDKIVRSIQAGASGYLLKKDSPAKIVEAIRNVHKGEGFINGQVARTLLNAFPRLSSSAPDFSKYHLTKRETEIVLLLIDGLSYKEIIARSFISMATLNTHVRNIYDKLGLHSRSEIAAKFRR